MLHPFNYVGISWLWLSIQQQPFNPNISEVVLYLPWQFNSIPWQYILCYQWIIIYNLKFKRNLSVIGMAGKELGPLVWSSSLVIIIKWTKPYSLWCQWRRIFNLKFKINFWVIGMAGRELGQLVWSSSLVMIIKWTSKAVWSFYTGESKPQLTVQYISRDLNKSQTVHLYVHLCNVNEPWLILVVNWNHNGQFIGEMNE